MEIKDSLKQIFLTPSDFFSSIYNEATIFRAWIFFVIAIFVVYIIKSPSLLQISNIFSFMLKLLLIAATPFVLATLSHMGLIIFGTKRPYSDTFRIISYSGVILCAYLSIGYVVLMIMNIFIPSDPSGSGLILFANLIFWAIFLAGLVHLIVVQVMGVKIIHNMDTVRAIAGLLLIPCIIGLIVGAIISFMMGITNAENFVTAFSVINLS